MTPEPMPATGPVPGEAAAPDVSRPEVTEPIPPAGPVPVEPEVTAVGPVETTREGRDQAPDGIEPCLVPSIRPESIADAPRGAETNPMAAVASARETNPIPAAGSADETNPISAPAVASADRRNRTSPDVAVLQQLRHELRRRADALSAAGYPVPILR
jgi:hypothetical protein